MSLHRGFWLCILTSCLSAWTPAQGASSLSNSLTGFSGDSNQAATQADFTAAGLSFFSTVGEVSQTNNNGTPDDPLDDFLEVTSNDTVTFDGAGAHVGGLIGGDGGRNNIRTVQADYATANFTAEVTFSVDPGLATQQVWMGLGAGDRALFGLPDWSTQFSSASFWIEPTKIVSFRTQNDVNAFVDTLLPAGPLADIDGAGAHRLQMTFDATTKQLRMSLDIDYAGGVFTSDVATTFPIVTTSLFAADGWPGEPSRIFFGGDDGVVFRDLVITTAVPEPLSLVTLLFALPAAVAARRR